MRIASNEELAERIERLEERLDALTESRTNIQEKENDSHYKQCTEWEHVRPYVSKREKHLERIWQRVKDGSPSLMDLWDRYEKEEAE